MSSVTKKKIRLARHTLKAEAINPYHRLDPQVAIKNVGTHLYCRGIVLFRPEGTRRKWYYNPYFILFIEALYFGRSLVSLLVPLSNRQYFVYSGDYMYFIKAKTHINIAATQYMLAGLSILSINFVRYYLDRQPDFLKSLDFLAGKTSPARAGLHDPKNVLALLHQSRSTLNMTNFNTGLVCLVSFVMSILPLMIHCTATEVLLYGLPWSVIFAVSSYYTFSSYFWNMAYFYILCQLIKFRLREASDTAQRAMQNPRLFRKTSVYRLNKQLQRIQSEVQRYNTTYWSSYLFVVVSCLSTFNNVVLYAALFVPMHLVVQMSLFYANFLSCAAIFFLLNTASVVYHESDHCRVVLSSLYTTMQKTLSYRTLFKLHLTLQGLSGKIIGFYFLNLFIINYFRFFEISGMIIAYFLKITDMSRNNSL